jgi:hypothetical protein
MPKGQNQVPNTLKITAQFLLHEFGKCGDCEIEGVHEFNIVGANVIRSSSRLHNSININGLPRLHVFMSMQFVVGDLANNDVGWLETGSSALLACFPRGLG